MIFNKNKQYFSLFAAFIALFFCPGPRASGQNSLFIPPVKAVYGGLGLPDDPLPAKTALRTGRLPNGLRYYILENSLPADRAYLTLAVNAGSVLEKDDEQGLAHFVEHMAFSGTARFPGADLVNYLRSLGMRFGPEVNAYTSYDETVYGIETPVENAGGVKRIPEKALAILDDWTWTVTFNPADVDKERSIIMEEYRSRLGAQERVQRKIIPVIFRDSRYAERLPIGLPDIIQTVTPDQLKNFYQTWYRPDNMAVILVGDFDGAVLERELAFRFTAPSRDALDRPYYELPGPQSGSLTAEIVTDPEIPNSVVYLYYKRSPQAPEQTLRGYREWLIDYLSAIMIDFRAEEAVSREDNPFVNAGAWDNRCGRESRYYIMAAMAKTGRSADTLRALLEEKERLVRYGFTAAELDRAKGALLSELERLAAEQDRLESEDHVYELSGGFLNDHFVLDAAWKLKAANALLPGITRNTVNAALRSYFADNDVTVLVTAPEAETPVLPGRDAVFAMVRESRVAEVAPPREQQVRRALVDETPAPQRIVSALRDESGAEIWNLSNGMQVILMETANRNNELSFYALARGGTVDAAINRLSDQNNKVPASGPDFSAELAAELQSASGLGPLNRIELLDLLSDKQVSLSFWTNSYIRGFQGSAAVKDLEYLLRMLYVNFTAPRIDETGLKVVVDQYRTRLLQEAENPEAVFFKELSRFLSGGHPLLRSLEVEDLDSVNAAAGGDFLRTALNPADYVVVFAGSLGDREHLRSLAETWLASIPNTDTEGNPRSRWNSWSDPGIKRPGTAEQIIRKGKEEKALVYMSWYAPKSWTEADNAAVLVLKEYLDIVLTDEIREALGGVYSIFEEAALTPMPRGELALGVYFICDPGREAELRRAVRERLASLAAGGIDEETFRRAREALVKTFERSMENNSFIARNLANFTLITGVPLSRLARRPALYRSVTAEQVRNILVELLPGGPAELVLLPETADN
ncbi:MAG: insulinase family protein [Spirochaetaceae bacterium]|jgi:zinc protease|nr:insulinase family protein [Spirochaetaceae bacterium]